MFGFVNDRITTLSMLFMCNLLLYSFVEGEIILWVFFILSAKWFAKEIMWPNVFLVAALSFDETKTIVYCCDN